MEIGGPLQVLIPLVLWLLGNWTGAISGTGPYVAKKILRRGLYLCLYKRGPKKLSKFRNSALTSHDLHKYDLNLQHFSRCI